MKPRAVALFILSSTFLQAAASPAYSTSTGALVFAASDLVTNSMSAARVALYKVARASEHGGAVAVINTQAWVRTFDATGSLVMGFASGPDRKLSVLFGNNSFTTVGFSADGTSLWTNRFDHPGKTEIPRTVAMDRNGNCFVVAESQSSTQLKSIVTIKYSPGGAPLWTNIYNETGTNYHQVSAIAVDSTGDVSLGIATFDNGAGYYTVLKYSSSGIPAWTNRQRFSAFSSDWIADLACDASGNLFATGGDFVTFKYSPAGITLWTNRLSGNAPALAADRMGDVIVTGDTFQLVHRYATVKFSALGVPLWTNYMTAPTFQGGNVPRVFTDPDNNIFLLGGTGGSSWEDIDLSVTKLNPQGAVLWTNRYFAAGHGITPHAVGMDCAGNLSFAIPSTFNGTNYDYLTLKYDADGVLVASNRLDRGAGDDPFSLGIDESGDVYVGGKTDSGVTVVKYANYIEYTPPTNFIGTDTFTCLWKNDKGGVITNTVQVVVQPALFFSPVHSPSELRLEGATSNRLITIFASPDLNTWAPIASKMAQADTVEFGITPTNKLQFYRAEQTTNSSPPPN